MRFVSSLVLADIERRDSVFTSRDIAVCLGLSVNQVSKIILHDLSRYVRVVGFERISKNARARRVYKKNMNHP